MKSYEDFSSLPDGWNVTLLEHGLADEVVLVVYPVLLGTGKRFFAEGTPAQTFERVSTRAMPSGVILNTYGVSSYEAPETENS